MDESAGLCCEFGQAASASVVLRYDTYAALYFEPINIEGEFHGQSSPAVLVRRDQLRFPP
jgi:hypothetical protein